MAKQTISVIIPTYNRRHCVMNAVNSVLRQSSCFNFEIVVSDDGSTDKTSELFEKNKDSRIVYILNKQNKGVNAARNTAIKNSKGDYVFLLDSDDILTDDAFKKIYENKKNFQEINFFGTANIKNGQKLYILKKEGNFSYKEWLEQKKIRGEFIPLVRREVFEKDLFDENRLCFESFFWNKIIKKYDLYAKDIVCRLYSFQDSNRVSKELMNPKNFEKRYSDYSLYAKEFEKDYLKFGLKKQLGTILFRVGFYGVLSKHSNDARKYFKKSMRYGYFFFGLFAFLLSFLGQKTFYNTYLILKKIKRVEL